MRAIMRQVSVLCTILAAFWLVFLINGALGGALLQLGIVPRTVAGLRGILFAPFLHGSLQHLMANAVPFLVLGWMVMLRNARYFMPVTVYAMLGSGLVAWTLGAPRSVHVGASGVIFGYLGFLLLSGIYSRSARGILMSIVTALLWGGLVLGIAPGQAGISWQAHLGGFAGGIIAARRLRR